MDNVWHGVVCWSSLGIPPPLLFLGQCFLFLDIHFTWVTSRMGLTPSALAQYFSFTLLFLHQQLRLAVCWVSTMFSFYFVEWLGHFLLANFLFLPGKTSCPNGFPKIKGICHTCVCNQRQDGHCQARISHAKVPSFFICEPFAFQVKRQRSGSVWVKHFWRPVCAGWSLPSFPANRSSLLVWQDQCWFLRSPFIRSGQARTGNIISWLLLQNTKLGRKSLFFCSCKRWHFIFCRFVPALALSILPFTFGLVSGWPSLPLLSWQWKGAVCCDTSADSPRISLLCSFHSFSSLNPWRSCTL